MGAFNGLWFRFSRRVKFAAQKQHKNKWRTVINSHVAEIKTQAVSDGELNMSARGCGGSSSSLPGTPGGEAGPANSVLSWAVSFEKLLEDTSGVRYFTAFLKSEVSAENILFWQDCEKFRKIPATSLDEVHLYNVMSSSTTAVMDSVFTKMKAAARSIYNTYLSDCAFYSVNIDDSAKTEEKNLEQPTPEMFSKAQAQIFKLMKMDSYRRFVRSPLYQRCTLSSVEGKPLPPLSTDCDRGGSWENVALRSPLSDKKNKRPDSHSLPCAKSPSENLRQKRGSWGDSSYIHGSDSQKAPHMSVKSTSSVELGALHRQLENGRSSPRSPEQGGVGGGRLSVEGGYCCVYLPDGSASLAPTRNGQTIKDMLASLCEKRGFPLKDVIIYLQGKEKPLSLDQDCSVLRDQQVSLELRVTLAVEIAFTGKMVGMVVKSNKTLQDALSLLMLKHNIKPQEALVTMVGSDEPVNMSGPVFRVANKTLRLDRIKGKDQTNISRASGSSVGTQAGGASAGPQAASPLLADKVKARPRKNRDMDGFLDMLTKAQGCRVDDQRGLLTKEHLEVPLFLQLPSDEDQYEDPDKPGPSCSSVEDSKVEPKDETPSSSVENVEEMRNCPEPDSEDLRETAV